MQRVAAALGANHDIEIPEAQRARAAAYVITASEGASLHLQRLRTRATDYDPAIRDRLIAGAMIPAALVNRAQKFRRWYRGEVLKLFDQVDAILAPATPCTAPAIGQQTFVIDGVELPVRPNIGIYTQPISFIGLPVVAVPVPLVAAADRRAGDRTAMAGGHRAANRLRVGAGGCLLAPRRCRAGNGGHDDVAIGTSRRCPPQPDRGHGARTCRNLEPSEPAPLPPYGSTNGENAWRSTCRRSSPK